VNAQFAHLMTIFENLITCRVRTCKAYTILLLIVCLQSHAQEPRKYSFTHYGTSQGLISNDSYAVTQDPQGYIWIGSSNGLQRYDGVRFKNFRPIKKDSSTIPVRNVQQLMLDHKKNLWIHMPGDNVGIFDTRNFRYIPIPLRISNPIFRGGPKKIINDERNILVVIAQAEMLTYNERLKEFSPAHNFIRLPEGWRPVDLVQVPGTKKYIIGCNNGLLVYNHQSGQSSYSGHNVEKEPLIDALGTLKSSAKFMIDRKGRFWFDIWDGFPRIYAYDLRKNGVLNAGDLNDYVKGYHEISGFIEQSNGEIWVNGLNVFARFLESEKRFQLVYNGYENEQSIYYGRVNCLYEDREHNIWVATDNNGVYRFNPEDQFFTNVAHINRVANIKGRGGVMALIPTRNNSLLVGTWGDGLYHYDNKLNQIPINIKGYNEKITPSAWSLFASRDSNTIWAGAQPGIHRIDQEKGMVTIYDPPLMKHRTVRQIAEDYNGNLWMGTQSLGVFKWTAEKGKKNFDEGITAFKEIPETMIMHVNVDKQGFVWVSTAAFGVYRIDPNTDKVVQHFGANELEDRRLLWDGVAGVYIYDDTTL
jgi:ligand-binding sensor domain-containing protein